MGAAVAEPPLREPASSRGVHEERPSPTDIASRRARVSAETIDALTGLRGGATMWVLLSHVAFTDALTSALGERLDWGIANGVIRHEYLAVDLFFMLSGFVLTHVHGEEFAARIDRPSYSRFLLLRLARVYPLHLLALLAILALHLFVEPNPLPASNAGCFALHLTMMASWGFCSGVSWNAPAWSLSSEWLAYLVLPPILLFTVGLKRLRTKLLALGLWGVAFVGIFFSNYCFRVFQFETDYSNGAGAGGRVMLGVILGSILRRVYDEPRVRRLPWAAIFWCSLPLAASFMTGLDGRRLDNSPWAYLAVMTATFAAACAIPRRVPILTLRLPVYLGRISYAAYILQFPVLLAMRHAFGPRLDDLVRGNPPAVARLVVAGSTSAVLAVAAIAHHTIEEPLRRAARGWIRARYGVD